MQCCKAAAERRKSEFLNKKIRATLKRIEEDGRATAARRAGGQQEAEDGTKQQEQARGFTEEQKKQFRQAIAIKRIRLGRGSSGAKPFSYTRKGLGDGREFRTLKKIISEYLSGGEVGSVLSPPSLFYGSAIGSVTSKTKG